jgi:hypothetical protein
MLAPQPRLRITGRYRVSMSSIRRARPESHSRSPSPTVASGPVVTQSCSFAAVQPLSVSTSVVRMTKR